MRKSFSRLPFHGLLLVAAAAAVFLYLKLFLWIGPFGWPLGGPGAHGGFDGSVRIVLVPVVATGLALMVALVARIAWRQVLTARFVVLATLFTTLSYFLFFDQSFIFGSIWRPLGLAWLANLDAGTPLWQLRLVGVLKFWLLLELACWLSQRSQMKPAEN